MLAKAYMALGRGSDAVQAYERAVFMVPDNAELVSGVCPRLSDKKQQFLYRPAT